MNSEKMIEMIEIRGYKNVEIVNVEKYNDPVGIPGRVAVKFTHEVFGKRLNNEILIRTHNLPAGE